MADETENPPAVTPPQQRAIQDAIARELPARTRGSLLRLLPQDSAIVTIYSLGLRGNPAEILGDPRSLAMRQVWGVRRRVIHIDPPKLATRDVWDEAEWVVRDTYLATALRALSHLSAP